MCPFICLYVHINVCMCVCVCVCVCVSVCLCKCVCACQAMLVETWVCLCAACVNGREMVMVVKPQVACCCNISHERNKYTQEPLCTVVHTNTGLMPVMLMMPHSITFAHRDNEEAYVSLNDQICWTKTRILATNGQQQCGGFFKEEIFPVRGCYVTLPPADTPLPLRVKVWTNLDGDANDESFGIDNVVIKKEEGDMDVGKVNKFGNEINFEGWSCGEVTTCGVYGQICGGYDVKGAGHNLTKTFMLPPGMYSVELDFIKIDSWCVCVSE